MNILIAANGKYLKHEKVMLASLRASMPQESIDIYFMHGKMEKQIVDDFLLYVVKRLKMQLHSIEINNTPFDECSIRMHLSIETMYRLIAPINLPATVERILWLDGDIVINGSLKEMYDIDIEDKYLCVCKGRGEIYKNNFRLNLPEDFEYFNAGVLLMNIKKMRENGSVDRFVGILSEYDNRLTWMDQDILNIAFCHGGVKYLPSEIYNCQIGSDFSLSPQEFKAFKRECKVMHFAATAKPWNIVYKNGLQKYYWHYALQDGRWCEFLKYCFTAPLRTMYLKYKWKTGKIVVE